MRYLDDILGFLGIATLLANTYYINWIIGNYLLAIILILLGFLVAKQIE